MIYSNCIIAFPIDEAEKTKRHDIIFEWQYKQENNRDLSMSGIHVFSVISTFFSKMTPQSIVTWSW